MRKHAVVNVLRTPHMIDSFAAMSLTSGQRLGAIIIFTSCPAVAQIDLGGEWAATFHEDLQHRGGVRLGDYTGLPLNESGWRKAQSWDESARSTFERQCIPHVVTYAMRGPANIRFSKIVDPVSGELQAYSLLGSYGGPRTIWMDGRELSVRSYCPAHLGGLLHRTLGTQHAGRLDHPHQDRLAIAQWRAHQ